jgi:hypothetical protein
MSEIDREDIAGVRLLQAAGHRSDALRWQGPAADKHGPTVRIAGGKV